jgi:glutathione S-transferase
MSELTLVIGNKNYSSWSLRPWVFLKKFNIDFNEQWVSLFVDSTKDNLAPYNSDNKVPALTDGKLNVWDSLAIIDYVSEKYMDGKGWPSDNNARALARSVSAEMHASFPNLRGEMPMNCRKHFANYQLTPAAAREVERVKSLWRLCRKRHGNDGDWLFGAFSAADAMYAPVAIRFNGYDVALDGIEKDYVKTVIGDPTIKQWMSDGAMEPEVIEQDEVKV